MVSAITSGLGIVQKLQQKSAYAEERASFLLIAFLLAAAISLLASSIEKNKQCVAPQKSTVAVAACVGLFFGCCNLLNTSLAGMLDSAILFPTLNIGVILLSILCGALLFKEKISKKELSVLLLGILSIALLNLG
jgi:glucose uptake protein GlcU